MAKKTTKKAAAKKKTVKKAVKKKTTTKKAVKKKAAATKKSTKKTATKKAEKTPKPVVGKKRRKPARRNLVPQTKLIGKSRAGMGALVRVRKQRHKDLIIVLDFGSQYTQLIARRTRESKVYSQIVPFNISAEEVKKMNPKGIILSGGPLSVFDKNAPMPDKDIFDLDIPILGVCYGMQVIAHMFKGKVKPSKDREFGRAELFVDSNIDLFSDVSSNITCWMSHSDEVKELPKGFVKLGHTLNAKYGAMANRRKKIFAVQFHPEVAHTQRGLQVIQNFVYKICGCLPRWTPQKFAEAKIKEIKEKVGNKKVVLGLSGGVDSSVTALLLSKAIGKQLYCIFVDNGLLRKNEVEEVQKMYKGHFKLNLTTAKAEKRFLDRLKKVEDPEKKRKIIGDEFVKVFQDKAKRIKGVAFLGQGTLYPDVIESVSPLGGPSATIKSHHNVGGLPKSLKWELVEPLRELFKDEVREIGTYLGLPEEALNRHPFPGPGLAIRIIGDVTKERLNILREVDDRAISEIKKAGLYDEIWQAFSVLLPVKSVGVMGDKRTYENVVALRFVTSTDGMTADWADIPGDVLRKISNRVINEVEGVNRVVYDISSKPPATIEWE